MTNAYAAHARFIRPAWPMRDLWRVIVVMALVETLFGLSPQVMTAVMSAETIDSFYGGTTARGAILNFFSFGIVTLGLTILVRALHGRGFWSMIGPPLAAINDLRLVIWAVCGVLLAIEIGTILGAVGAGAIMRPLLPWLLILPMALAAILVQVATEEIVFRGYLQQQLACLSPSPIVWMVLPSFLFGLLHYWNGFGQADGLVWAIWAGLLGMACADLTARSGNLGAAIGLHMANNIFAVMIYAVEDWPMSGLALFLYPFEDPDSFDYALETLANPWMVLHGLTLALSVLVMWLAARIALRR
jgi:membrane protease YdiL (CAAX protease family)